MLMFCVKHNNSHFEMKSGTNSLLHVFKSSSKDVLTNMLIFVKIPSTITSSMGFKSRRVNSVKIFEIISPLKKLFSNVFCKSNSSRAIPSCERKLEIDFIPSAVISQPENGQTEKCFLRKYVQYPTFSLICSFSILQQDEHNLHLQSSCILFGVEM